MVHCSPGDLWRLGDHFVLCGDSTKSCDVHRLMDAVGHTVKASAIITDPPYGKIHASWDRVDLSFVPLLSECIAPDSTCILFCTLPYGFLLNHSMLSAGWQFRFDQVWSKKNGGFLISKKMPIRCHEHLFAYARSNAKVDDLVFHGYDAGEVGQPWGDRHDKASWSHEVYSNRACIERVGRADGRRWIRSVLVGRKKTELPKSERTTHATQKPLELVTKLVLLVSDVGDVIYDGFLGSGTTLLACELTGRRCVSIEINPDFVAMVIDRWQTMTGKEATLCPECP